MKLKVGEIIINVRDDERGLEDLDVVKAVFIEDTYGIKRLAEIAEIKTVVDIGGHIGTFGLLIKSLWRDAKVYGFEPNKISFELYQKNVYDNKFNSDFILYNKAVDYDKNRTVLTDGIGATGGGFLIRQEDIPRLVGYSVFSHNIDIITLDEFIESEKIEKIDLLKLDCEGSEIRILENMPNDIAERISLVVGEYHIEGGWKEWIKLFSKAFGNRLIVKQRRGKNDDCNIAEFVAFSEEIWNKLCEYIVGEVYI